MTEADKWAEAKRWVGQLPRDDFDKLLLLVDRRFEDGKKYSQAAFAEREAGLVEALREISDLHGEINPCNYGHDDVCELNRQFCYAITSALAAIKEPST